MELYCANRSEFLATGTPVEVSHYEYKYICIHETPSTNATRPVRCHAKQRSTLSALPLDGTTGRAIVTSRGLSLMHNRKRE